jgi:hypothetical protein
MPGGAVLYPAIAGDEALAFLLASAGLQLTDGQKADLKTIYDRLEVMNARVRQPRGSAPAIDHSRDLCNTIAKVTKQALNVPNWHAYPCFE